MVYTVSITKKGQMTIPKDVRERLDIAVPGKVMIDVDKQGRLTLRKPVALEDIRGIIGPPAGQAEERTERQKIIIAAVKKNPKYAEFFKKAARR